MADPFVEHRRLLFSVAYNLLGSVADAEDVVQETWLRWSRAERADVRDPRAYLVRIATRQALNRLRANRARREQYIGPWLPEPLVTEPDPSEQVTDKAERTEQISLAMLVVLETLSPVERAVFVLREVFGMSHDDIAAALGRSAATVRQLAHRAREHVQARRPRFDSDTAEQRRITEQFLLACLTGDLSRLTELLAPDAIVLSDGGGKAKAARRPVTGADKVARLMIGIAQEAAQLSLQFVLVNGTLGIAGFENGTARQVATLDIVDGRVATVFIVANPDKLASIAVPPGR